MCYCASRKGDVRRIDIGIFVHKNFAELGILRKCVFISCKYNIPFVFDHIIDHIKSRFYFYRS